MGIQFHELTSSFQAYRTRYQYKINYYKKWKCRKGKMPQIGVKRLDKIRPKLSQEPVRRRRFRPGTKALREIHKFQKSTELLIPKMPFLQLLKEVLQWEHGDHHIQAGAVLALHKATEAYIIQLLEDTNLCAYLCEMHYYPT